MTMLAILLAAQGLIGSVQYELRLPTDMVWVHVTLATLTWLAVLWVVADAGALVPRTAAVPLVDATPVSAGSAPAAASMGAGGAPVRRLTPNG
jgi:heme A synthase